MTKAADIQRQMVATLCERWTQAARLDYVARYGEAALGSFRDIARFTQGVKMFHLVIGSSSAFLVDIGTGVIYGNKSWLKMDRHKIVGNAYHPQFDANALVRDRFRYGHFENNPDGSLRQPIVRR